MDQIDRKLLDLLQTEFPLQRRPYNTLARRIGISEEEAISRTKHLKESGVIRQIGAIFDSARLGYQSALVAFAVPADSIDAAAEAVSSHPGVSHNYLRDHEYSLWFTLTVPPESDINRHVSALATMAGAVQQLFLPTVRVFKIGVNFAMNSEGEGSNGGAACEAETNGADEQADLQPLPLSDLDRQMVRLLQEDLPIVKEPFAAIAEAAECSEGLVLQKADAFLQSRAMRRFAAILRHQEAGYTHNVLTVWAAKPDQVESVGRTLASYPSVSHCYQRATSPDWPYNLYAMLHARSAEEADLIVEDMAQKTATEHLLLRTQRELKKCRAKYFNDEIGKWEREVARICG